MKSYAVAAAFTVLLCACNPQTPVPPATPASTATPDASAEASDAATGAPATQELAVVNWGQKETPAGVPFNVQADGNSGISLELNQPAPAEVTVTLGGKPLTGVVSSGVIVTATIPQDYLATPGSYPLELEIATLGIKTSAGNFEVLEK